VDPDPAQISQDLNSFINGITADKALESCDQLSSSCNTQTSFRLRPIQKLNFAEDKCNGPPKLPCNPTVALNPIVFRVSDSTIASH
jgi:hypothetical protein